MKLKFSKKLKIASLLGLGVASIGIATPLIVSCSDDGDSSDQVVPPEKNPDQGGTPDDSYKPSPEIESIISKKSLEAANYGLFVRTNMPYKILYGNNKQLYDNQNFKIEGDKLIFTQDSFFIIETDVIIFDNITKVPAKQKFNLTCTIDLSNLNKNGTWSENVIYSLDKQTFNPLNKSFNKNDSQDILYKSFLYNKLKESKDIGYFYTLNDQEKRDYIKSNKDVSGMSLFYYNGNELYELWCTGEGYISRLVHIKNTNIDKLDLSKKVNIYGIDFDINEMMLYNIEFLNGHFDVSKYFPNLNNIIISNTESGLHLKSYIKWSFSWTVNKKWEQGPNNTLIVRK